MKETHNGMKEISFDKKEMFGMDLIASSTRVADCGSDSGEGEFF